MATTHDMATDDRLSAHAESIRQQSAIMDVLKAMSASPGDAQPVFDLIVRRAVELCGAPNATLFEFDGELVHWRSMAGWELFFPTADALEAYRSQSPMAPTRVAVSPRSILDRRIVHVRDVDADPEISQVIRDFGVKSMIPNFTTQLAYAMTSPRTVNTASIHQYRRNIRR